MTLFKKTLASILAASLSLPAFAWEPTKPVEVVVGFAPGSGNEISFRGISAIVQKNNPGVDFLVINRPGADGVVAMNEFISKPSDGYHLYVPSHQGIWVTAEFFNAQAKRYTLDDFEYLVSLAKSPLAVIAAGNSDVSTVPEFLKKLKDTDKPVNVAAGSGAHKLAFNYMATKVKINQDLVKTIGYKGPAQAVTDVVGGHVEFGIVPIAVAAPLVKSGKIKLIGLCSEQPIAGFENAPLMNKWVPGMNVYAAWGIILPKGTPSVIREWYVTEFSKAIRSPEAKEFFAQNYMFTDPRELTPEGFKASMMKLREQWVPILKDFKLE